MSSRKVQHTLKPRLHKEEPRFRVFANLFKKMNKERDLQKVKAVGGVRELAKAIGVDVEYGIDTSSMGQSLLSIQDREEVFGKNTMKAIQPTTSFAWTKALLKSPFLTRFVIISTITTILGLSFGEGKEHLGWIDYAGMWVFVIIIVFTSVALDCQQFQSRGQLNRKKDVFDVIVLRDGREKLIKNSHLLVGDILVLTKDVLVAADGLLLVDNELFINEEIVSGESRPVKKKLDDDPFCYCGTQVTSGSGKILVTGVGQDTELGQTLRMVAYSTAYAHIWIRNTKNFFGMYTLATLCLGVLSFVVLLIRWTVGKISNEGPVEILIRAIVIVIVELQEGYSLLVLFSRVYTSWILAKDKIYVCAPGVLGWMSYVKSICFDKTGTLTENKMTVTEGWFQGSYFNRVPDANDLDTTTLELISENASLNSEAFLNDDDNAASRCFGNQIECALLVMIEKLGVNFSEVRMQKRQYIIKNYGFNSDKKMSSTVIRQGDFLRLYNKGAAEMVLNKCTQYIDPSGSRNPIFEDKRIEMETTIKRMASQGLRTLALTYADLHSNKFNFSENGEPLDEFVEGKRGFAEAPEEDLVLLAIVGIKDPIREGVPEVVEQFKKAKIRVRMITGDSLDTAKRVARECGILTSEGIAMEGAELLRWAEESFEGLKKDLSRIQVLARSSPFEKQKLVDLLMSVGEKVIVCGDGTNDARALTESNVGIAMGTNSTEIAREAADVVVLSNNISSILTLYLWSQRDWLSFCGYLQVRSSVTLVVWIVVLVSVCIGGETPLNVHQFLWANFVIDTLVVLTFATESRLEKVPNDETYQTKRDPMANNSYWVRILLQSLYQITVILCTYYSLSSLFERYTGDDNDLVKMRKNSLMFNIFVFMQLFNSLNCRKVYDEYNIFEGLFDSPLSLAIRLVTVGLQLMIMLTPVRTLFKLTKLNAWEWLYSIGVSVVVIPLSTWIKHRARK